MATASRNVRKIRRIKRERTLALRAYAVARDQRNQAQMVAYTLEQELRKFDLKPEETTSTEPSLTIVTLPDEETEGVNQTDLATMANEGGPSIGD